MTNSTKPNTETAAIPAVETVTDLDGVEWSLHCPHGCGQSLGCLDGDRENGPALDGPTLYYECHCEENIWRDELEAELLNTKCKNCNNAVLLVSNEAAEHGYCSLKCHLDDWDMEINKDGITVTRGD